MANEVTVQCNVTLSKRDSSNNQLIGPKTHSKQFRRDMDGALGPTPGAFNVPVGGVSADLDELTVPGVAWIEHQGRADGGACGDDDVLLVGMRDLDSNIFMPLMELFVGEGWPVPLYRHLTEEFSGTGTATTGPTNQLFFKPYGSNALSANLEAYER